MKYKDRIQELKELTLHMAALSPCTKRKVGAVIIDKYNNVLSKSYNKIPSHLTSEFDEDGNTHEDVTHAEVNAIKDLTEEQKAKVHKIFISHEPCDKCRIAIIAAGIKEYEVVNNFMKFDTNKLRYDLVPPIIIEELAKVFTYGAKKYKPKNYLECTDRDRFVAALFRHIEAWRKGEDIDPESNLHHLSHAACNITILMELISNETFEKDLFDFQGNN